MDAYNADRLLATNPGREMNRALSRMEEESAGAYRRTIRGDNAASIAMGAVAGALLSSIMFDLLDR